MTKNVLEIIAMRLLRNFTPVKIHRLVLALTVLMLPLAVLLGPRVGFPEVPLGDFRTQDVIVAGSVLYFLYLDLKRVFAPTVHGAQSTRMVIPIFWSAVLIPLAFIGLLVANSSAIFPIFYVARLFEPLIIGLVMYRALDALGQRAIWIFVISTGGALVLNLTWVGAQVLLQRYGSFWSFSYQPSKEQYGPGLIGDFAAFPTGQTFVVVLAGLIGFYFFSPKSSRNQRIILGVLIFATLGAVILVHSRVSTIVAIVLFVVWAIKIFRSYFGPSVALTSSLIFGSTLFLTILVPRLPRFGAGIIERGLDDRIVGIYPIVLRRIVHQFFFGAGPGVVRSETGWEHHSLYLGFLSSFGIVGLIVTLTATTAVVWIAQSCGLASTNPLLKIFAFWTVAILSNLLFAGLLQDSYIAVAPNHLGAMVIGAFFWLLREEVSETGDLWQWWIRRVGRKTLKG